MDLKKEIAKILDVYGCLDIYDENKFSKEHNQIRNKELVNDLFALYGLSLQSIKLDVLIRKNKREK